jgi:hypothetical protein
MNQSVVPRVLSQLIVAAIIVAYGVSVLKIAAVSV